MNNGRITLSMKEQRTSDILVKLISEEIKLSDAQRLLALSKRQVLRKKKAFLERGIASLPHKSRGQPSGRGYGQKFKDWIVHIYTNEYPGWNFHHFNDVLQDQYQINVSDSFIHKLLTANGIESPLKLKKGRKEAHPPRERRENAGELVQVDASPFQWFFGDDQYYSLHGAIDDATSTVTGAYFTKNENTLGYQMVMAQTISNYGIPVSLYSDHHAIFHSNKQTLTIDEELQGKQLNDTKFAKMLKRLGTDIIPAESPQAKGRIERLWKTLQNRLYNEFKKFNISSIEEANDYLTSSFIPRYNDRFALPIDDTKNLFVRPFQPFDFNIELATWQDCSIYHNCYIRFNKQYFVILDNGAKTSISGTSKAQLYTFLDGSLHLFCNDRFFDLRAVDIASVLRSVSSEHKLVNTSPAASSVKNGISKAHKPAANHPWAYEQQMISKKHWQVLKSQDLLPPGDIFTE